MTVEDGVGEPVRVAWIDAREPACGRRLWGMNLVERQIRQLCRRGVRHFWIHITAASSPGVRRFRPDLFRLYSFRHVFVESPFAPDLQGRLAADRPEMLVLQGDAVYDQRVFEFLLAHGSGHCVRCSPDGPLAACLSAEQAQGMLDDAGLGADEQSLRGTDLEVTESDELDSYVASLRLVMPAVMERVPASGSLARIDHLMYRRTFKGVIDVVARYGYYHLVRWITRHLSNTSLPPNLFTVLSIAAVWGAVPVFASGHLGIGVTVAWAGVILDSVDGKLARLRLHLSDAMGAVEHVAAMPGLGLWYLATGWHLTGGDLIGGAPLAQVTWALVAAFLLDKCVTGGFRALTGKELFDYGSVDSAFHLVAARRNISLVLLTLGAALDAVAPAFVLIAVWTGVTLLVHTLRFAWIAASRGVARRHPG